MIVLDLGILIIIQIDCVKRLQVYWTCSPGALMKSNGWKSVTSEHDVLSSASANTAQEV